MESLFGLPAHIFLVHAPVVLTPLICAAAVAVAVRPSWRKRYGLLLLVSAAALFISIVLAASSGEALDDIVGELVDTEKHQSLGETTRLLAFGLLVSVAGLVGYPWVHARRNPSDSPSTPMAAVVNGLALATIVFAVLATVWVIRTGHEGANLVWNGVIPEESG